VEISVRNLLGNPGLDRNYVGGAARAERNVALENIFKFTRAGCLLKGPICRYPNHLGCDRQSFGDTNGDILFRNSVQRFAPACIS
jgi:hypothetical protein